MNNCIPLLTKEICDVFGIVAFNKDEASSYSHVHMSNQMLSRINPVTNQHPYPNLFHLPINQKFDHSFLYLTLFVMMDTIMRYYENVYVVFALAIKILT